MTQEAHELLVSVRPDGMDETTDGLEDVSDQFQDTADETEDAAELLQEFGNKFRRAGAVVIAGLGTVAAGLLAHIPVIGEAATGLFSILDAIILRVDDSLRPAISDVTTALFELSDSILAAQGDLGLVIDAAAIAGVTFLGLLAAAGLVAGALFAASAAAGVLGVGLLSILSVIGIVAVAAGALWLAWQKNFGDMQNLTVDFIEAILEGRLVDALGFLLEYTENVLNFWVDLFIQGWGELAKVFFQGWNAVHTTGEMFINRIQTGIEGLFALLIRGAKAWANEFAAIIEGGVNRALAAIPDDALEKAGLPSSVSINRPFSNVGSRQDVLERVGRRGARRDRAIQERGQARAGQIETQIEQLVAALQNQDVEIPLSLDSKQVAEETEKWAGNAARNAGASRFVR